MPAPKVPFLPSSIQESQNLIIGSIRCLEFLAEYFFEIVIAIVSLRLYHLREQSDDLGVANIVNQLEIVLDETQISTESNRTPEQEIQTLIYQCLKISPLSEETVWQLRQVSFTDRKNAYRRLRDAIETMGETQLLLLALAYEDGEYEQIFELDLQISED
jgi:hypothetical protein